MKNKNVRLTIFTPTYNRAHLLPKLYDSLCKQTNKDFVWMIVDDGSKDNTEELGKEWKKENKLTINYYKKENGGKNTAMDFAHSHCETEYIACVDSDDYLTEDGVSILYKHLEVASGNNQCIGLVCRREKHNGEAFNNSWCKKNQFLKFKDLSEKYGYSQDTFLIFKTEMIKNYLFPVIKDERFLTESIFYNQFMYDFDLYAFEDLIYVAEYMEDGYTNQGLNLFFKNPKGYLYALKQNAYCAIKYKEKFKSRLGYIARYYAWKRVNNIKDEFKNDYKLPFIYRLMGWILSPIVSKKFKKEFNNFKNVQNTKH